MFNLAVCNLNVPKSLKWQNYVFFLLIITTWKSKVTLKHFSVYHLTCWIEFKLISAMSNVSMDMCTPAATTSPGVCHYRRNSPWQQDQFNFKCTTSNGFKLWQIIKSCFSKLDKFETRESIFNQMSINKDAFSGQSHRRRWSVHTRRLTFLNKFIIFLLTLAVIDCLEWRHFSLSSLG